MLLHMKVHEGNDNGVPDEMFRTKNDTFSSIVRPRTEYDAPMNLVLTEQTGVQQKMLSSWPNLDLHDGFAAFQ